MGFLKQAEEWGLDQRIDGCQKEMIEKLTALVAIPSIATEMTDYGMPYGPDIANALHYALELAEKLGFATHNEDDRYGWAETGDRGPLVGIFTHLDIVPAGDGWTFDPFQVTEQDGCLYGRGILDNKGPAVACLYALKTCCDMGISWPCRVRIWFGTNEEKGMNDIQLYIRKYGAPDFAFVPDSQFPLSYSELGTTTFRIRNHYRREVNDQGQPLRLVKFETKEHANGIPPYASVRLEAESEELAEAVCGQVSRFAGQQAMALRASRQGRQVLVESEGRASAHWNDPWTAVNALAQLVLFLHTVSVGREADRLIGFVAEKIGTETDGASLGIRTVTETASLSLALEGVCLDDFGLAFQLFLIAPAQVRCEVLLDSILRSIRNAHMELSVSSMGPGFMHDQEMPLLKLLYQSYCQVTGSQDPVKVCGGTYAKFIPGAVPFGAIFTPEKDLCHVPDEHIEIRDLMLWTKIYANALLRIADYVEEAGHE